MILLKNNKVSKAEKKNNPGKVVRTRTGHKSSNQYNNSFTKRMGKSFSYSHLSDDKRRREKGRSYSIEALVNYRLNRAKEAFEDGELLLMKGRWNSAANRMYYACFYIVPAYLAKKRIRATTHSGLKATFNKALIKTAKVNKENGILFNNLFRLSQEAGYEDFQPVEQENIEPLIPKIKSLIQEIEKM